MNKAEYAEYEAAVGRFFEREGITNLTPGHIKCPDCDVEFVDGECPECGTDREMWDEPFFSWRPCECCGTNLGGDREVATGYHEESGQVLSYNVCLDCTYYATYGHLDDQTMLEIEQ